MNKLSRKFSGFVFFASGSLLAAACGDSSDEEGGGKPTGSEGDGDGAGDGDIDIVLGDGDGMASTAGTACTTDFDCTPLACHPVTGTCEQVGSSCISDAECAQGFFCNAATGLCLAGKVGSPCSSDLNCEGGGVCTSGTCGCAGFVQEQELSEGKLDIYYVFDHSTSMTSNEMGQPDPSLDCAYSPGGAPPLTSKACLATYAFSDYLLSQPAVDTRLALQFMSLEGGPGEDTCDGGVYAQPLIDMTALPVDPTHALISAISDDLFDTSGTQIEGALRGITQYTAANKVEGREMIGVLMTDGDPTQCDQNIGNLADIIGEHYQATGIRTFIIGVDGATESSLEQMAIEGGAQPHDDFCGSLTPPCHYWNVGDASGDVLAQALNAIINQSAPLGCEFPLSNIQPGAGMTLDPATINVNFTSSDGVETTVYNVPSELDCPPAELAWHYDDPANPTTIHLCPATCDVVAGTEGGAAIDIAGGCEPTVVIAR